MAEEAWGIRSRRQPLLGLGTWLGGAGKPTLIALEMRQLLSDMLPQYPSCLFHKKEHSLMVKSGGTGVLPASTQKGHPWAEGR